MKIKIHKEHKRVKDEMPEYQVDEKILNEAIKIAEKIKRSDLILFWLEDAAKESEDYFSEWLKDIVSFSKQELIDIIHELLERFIREFRDRKNRKK
jgi:hypothetical protein